MCYSYSLSSIPTVLSVYVSGRHAANFCFPFPGSLRDPAPFICPLATQEKLFSSSGLEITQLARAFHNHPCKHTHPFPDQLFPAIFMYNILRKWLSMLTCAVGVPHQGGSCSFSGTWWPGQREEAVAGCSLKLGRFGLSRKLAEFTAISHDGF